MLTQPPDDDNGDASVDSDSASGNGLAGGHGGRGHVGGAPSGTEAPAGTEAATATTAAAGAETTEATADTAAEATTAGTAPVDYTTIGGPGAELPVNTASSRCVPAVIWEQPPGGPACGPTTVEVVIPQSLGLTNPVVRWQTADLGW